MNWLMENTIDNKHDSKRCLVCAEELAVRYSVSTKTIRKWGQTGLLPVVKLSARCVRYPLQECDEVVRGRQIKALSQG